MTILLLGASGLVGGECLKLLAVDNFYTRVIAPTRKPLTATHSKIENRIVNFDDPKTYEHLVKCDQVICCMGSTTKKAGGKENYTRIDLEYPLAFAKLAKQNGAKHFLIVTSAGANPNAKIFYNRLKGQVEQAIESVGFQSLSIFRPSILIGDRQEHRAGEKFGLWLSKVLDFMIPLRYKPVEGRKVAQAILWASKENLIGKKIYESGAIQQMIL